MTVVPHDLLRWSGEGTLMDAMGDVMDDVRGMT